MTIPSTEATILATVEKKVDAAEYVEMERKLG
jgi:hypothetical protein